MILEIESKRLKLRAIETSDLNILLKLINDREIEKFTGGWSFPVSKAEQIKWIDKQNTKNNSLLRCMIEVKETKETIGTIILSDIDYKNGTTEIHIKLIKKGRKKGFASESIKLIEEYAFNELRLNRIQAEILNFNTNSLNLFKNLGYIMEGTLRQRIYKNGEYYDSTLVSKLVSDYNGNRQ